MAVWKQTNGRHKEHEQIFNEASAQSHACKRGVDLKGQEMEKNCKKKATREIVVREAVSAFNENAGLPTTVLEKNGTKLIFFLQDNIFC